MLLDGGHPLLRVTPGRRALLLAALGAALTILVTAAPAGAHNRRTAFLGDYGPYDVVASVRDLDQPGEDGILVELVVRTAGARQPVDDASLRVVGDAGDGSVGPLPVERYGNAYRVVFPGDDVDRWDVEVTLEGPPGRATLTEVVPGPRVLHDSGSRADLSAPAPSGGWLTVIVAAVVLVPLAGFTRRWRPVMAVVGAALLLAGATAAWEVWARPTTEPVERLGLVPVAGLGALLLTGLVLVGRGRDDARGLIFAGSAGLAVLVGWVNRDGLTTVGSAQVLSPGLAQAVAALALGLGAGLALLMVVLSRDQVRTLVSGLTHRSPDPDAGSDV